MLSTTGRNWSKSMVRVSLTWTWAKRPSPSLTWRPKMWAKNCAEACLSLAGTMVWLSVMAMMPSSIHSAAAGQIRHSLYATCRIVLGQQFFKGNSHLTYNQTRYVAQEGRHALAVERPKTRKRVVARLSRAEEAREADGAEA